MNKDKNSYQNRVNYIENLIENYLAYFGPQNSFKILRANLSRKLRKNETKLSKISYIK